MNSRVTGDIGKESSVTQTPRFQTLTGALSRLEMVVKFTGREGEATPGAFSQVSPKMQSSQ